MNARTDACVTRYERASAASVAAGLRRDKRGRDGAPSLALLLFFFLVCMGLLRSAAADAAPVNVTILNQTPQGIRLLLGDEEAQRSAVPPGTSEQRARALNGLRQFHAEYKQIGAIVTVSAQADNRAGQVLVRRVGNALAQFGLGRAAGGKSSPNTNHEKLEQSEPITDEVLATLYCAQRDRNIAIALLRALYPLMAGPVQLQWNPSLHTNQMRLFIH